MNRFVLFGAAISAAWLMSACTSPAGDEALLPDSKKQPTTTPVAELSATQLSRPGTVTIRANNTAGATKTEFFQDGRSLGVDTSAPFETQVPVTKSEASTRQFVVKSFNASGQSASSNPVKLQVNIGRVLYVAPDGNDLSDGLTEEKPLQTIQSAMDLTKPGDTVLVKNGTYSKKDVPNGDVVNISRSGEANAWITLMAYPGQKPKIEVANWVGIKVQASYIIVDGFELQGNLDQLTLEYAKAEQSNGNNPITGGSGISVAPPWNQKLVRPHHVIVRNNTVYKFPGSGIGSGSADYLTIEDNLIYSTAYYSPYDTSGISLYQNWNSDMTTGYKMIVRRNIVSDTRNLIPFIWSNEDPAKRVITDGNGIIIDDSRNTQNESTNGVYVGRTLVENNVSFGNGARGIHVYESDHVDIVNNTTLNNSFQPETPDGEITVNDAGDVRIFNNIIMPRADRKGVSRGSSRPSDLDSQIVKRNLIFGGLTADADPNLNLIGLNPKLVDPANYNFRPASDSPAVDAGDQSLSAAEDIERRARPAGAGIDLGAYEIR
jgi:hypothetical protein